MKKLMMAAVVAMFAVSAHAADAAKSKMTEVAGATEESCKAEKNTWKNGKCWKSETTATTAPADAAKTK